MHKLLNRHILLIASFIGCVFLSGCVDDLADPSAKPKDTVSIRFYSSERTRADGDPEDGVASLNENKLHNISVALSPLGADDADACIKFHTFSNLDENAEYNGMLTLTDEEVEKLFGTNAPSGKQCRVYAVANLSQEMLSSLEGKTPSFEDLKNIVVSSSFATKQVQDDFIMFGQNQVTLNKAGDTQSAAGTVALSRTAAKISLNINLPNQLEVTNEDGSKTTWIPLSGSGAMRVLLNRGVESSTVVSDGSANSADSYYDISTRSDNIYGFTDNYQNYPTYRWKQTYPFYTYPNAWTNSLSEKNRTYLTLIIPWYKSTEGRDSYETFYYSVPVTKSDMPKLTSNYSYTIDLNVGMLGSLEPEMPEEITGSYKVVNWMREDMDLNINDYRYLIVNPKYYKVDNSDKISIPFYSSHVPEVKTISIKYERFNAVTTGSGEIVNLDISKDIIDKSYSGSGENADSLCNYYINYNASLGQYYLNIDHPLKIWKPVNLEGVEIPIEGSSVVDIKKNLEATEKYIPTDENAYSPYEITVVICHPDHPGFSEEVIIKQYPAMYIAVEKNPGTNNGNRYVNGSSTTSRLNNSFLGACNSSGDGHSNVNMYIINVSVLSQDSKYIIGDPRMLFTDNNLSNEDSNGRLVTALENDKNDAVERTSSGGYYPSYSGWCVKSQALYDNAEQRTLRYYYPTLETEATKNMIAPKFRIASSYGTVSSSYLDNPKTVSLRRRCATYQEMGCPAGRWRLPTFGEIQYVIELHENGYIPRLFSPGAYYLSAQGWVYIPDTSDKDKTLTVVNTLPWGGSGTVRAVYDEWYWNNEKEYSIVPDNNNNYSYRLGDMPKRNPQPQQ